MSLIDLLRLLRPEEVAERIASGKLDMRPEAVAERREALFPETFYSGSTSPDILENPPTNMAPQYLWASESPGLAASYAGRRLNRRPDEAPTIYPLAVNTEGFDRLLGDYRNYNALENPVFLQGGTEPLTMQGIGYDTDGLIGFSYEMGSPGLLMQDIIDPGPYSKLMNLGVPSASGGRASQREIDEFLQELERNPPLNMAVPDTTRVRAKYGAAFDPDYTGPNILGLQGSTQKPSLLTAAANSATGGASLAVDQIPKGSNEDQLYQGLTDKMVDYLTAEMGGSEEDKQRAELISLGMDFLPVVGAAKGVSETFDAYKNDDTLGMALGAGGTLLGMIPFGRAAFKGVLGMVEDAPRVTRDTPLLQRVGDPDSVNQMKLEVEPGADLLPTQPISAADLEGRGFVSGMADTSRGDLSRVVAVNDQPIDMVRFGGQDYMRQPSNVEQGILWASDAGQVTGLTNAARAAAELPGATRGPLYIPYQMGPQSTDFATMTADIMVPIAKQNLSKTKKKALDKRIRSGAGNKTADMKPLPDWPGIDSPKVDEYLANAGGDRKAVTKAIDEFRDDAGINLSQARAAIVDAEQMAPRVGNLRQAGILDLAREPQPGRHPSYNTDLMGQYLGQFGEGANLLEDLTPLVRTTREPFVPLMLERGHELSGAKLPPPVGKAMQPGLIGMFDTETIDQLIKKGLITP